MKFRDMKNWKKIVYGGACAVCVIAIALTMNLNKKSNKSTEVIENTSVKPITTFDTKIVEEQLQASVKDIIEDAEVEKEPLLVDDGFPKINTLISKYLNAKLASSQESFEGLVSDPSSIDYNRLYRKVEYIVGYQNIKTYVAKGINEVDYVVYVTYDLELPSISTAAPSIDEIYVILDEDNQPKVYLSEPSEETKEFFVNLRSSEEVTTLIEEVNNKLIAAINSDSDLNDFYKSFASDSN